MYRIISFAVIPVSAFHLYTSVLGQSSKNKFVEIRQALLFSIDYSKNEQSFQAEKSGLASTHIHNTTFVNYAGLVLHLLFCSWLFSQPLSISPLPDREVVGGGVGGVLVPSYITAAGRDISWGSAASSECVG
jgi:hypothetical protein